MKKTLVVVLTLAMLLGAASIALANTSEDGTAKIEFIEGDIIIIPPPDDWEGAVEMNLDLYFGTHQIVHTTETHHSRGNGTTYAGLALSNGLGSAFTFQAQLYPFFSDYTATMEDAVLELTPAGAPVVTVPDSTLTPLNPELTAGGGARNILTGNGFGLFGSNWSGDLTVIGGTVATADEASAKMVWSLVNGIDRIGVMPNSISEKRSFGRSSTKRVIARRATTFFASLRA